MRPRRLLLSLVAFAILALAVLPRAAGQGPMDPTPSLQVTPDNPAGPSAVCLPGGLPMEWQLGIAVAWLAISLVLKRTGRVAANAPEELVANTVARVPILGALLRPWRSPSLAPPPPPKS